MPSIPLPNQPYPDPTPADPNPAPGRPPLLTETPGLEPVGVPSPAPSNIPLPNEPAGIPPTMPPEIPSSPTMPQPCHSHKRDRWLRPCACQDERGGELAARFRHKQGNAAGRSVKGLSRDGALAWGAVRNSDAFGLVSGSCPSPTINPRKKTS